MKNLHCKGPILDPEITLYHRQPYREKEIDHIGVFKTVMHYGYSGISIKTNLLSEKIVLYISQETFFLFYPRYNTIMHHGFKNSDKIYCQIRESDIFFFVNLMLLSWKCNKRKE